MEKSRRLPPKPKSRLSKKAESRALAKSAIPLTVGLPLIVRIYGIVMLIEGVVTLPIIVLSCLYVVQAVLSGEYDVRRAEPHHDLCRRFTRSC